MSWLTFALLPYAWLFALFWLLRFGLRLLIDRTSSPHRKSLLLSVQKNKEEYNSQKTHSPKSDDSEWEHVRESATSKTKAPQIPKDTSFDGFVGFFHPFA